MPSLPPHHTPTHKKKESALDSPEYICCFPSVNLLPLCIYLLYSWRLGLGEFKSILLRFITEISRRYSGRPVQQMSQKGDQISSINLTKDRVYLQISTTQQWRGHNNVLYTRVRLIRTCVVSVDSHIRVFPEEPKTERGAPSEHQSRLYRVATESSDASWNRFPGGWFGPPSGVFLQGGVPQGPEDGRSVSALHCARWARDTWRAPTTSG